MNLEGYDISNLNTYVDGECHSLIGLERRMPRKHKKELKKSKIFYSKEEDIVVICRGNRCRNVSFKKFFNECDKRRANNLGFHWFRNFILSEISKT